MGLKKLPKPMPSEIKGLSEVRRLPRKGKIRLGVKKISEGGKEYPAEVDYFVVPPEVAACYETETPKELTIQFPVSDKTIVAARCYELYGQTKGLKCRGDGTYALERDETSGEWTERDCPCEQLDKKKCGMKMHLKFVLPAVGTDGVYQIDTGSINSMLNVHNFLDWLCCTTISTRFPHGMFAWIPLILYREKIETHYDGKKQIHYPLKLRLAKGVKLPTPSPDFILPNNEERKALPEVVPANQLAEDVDFETGEVGAGGREISDIPPDTIPPCEGPEEPPSQGNDFTLAAAKDVLEEGFVASGVDGQAFTEAAVAKTGKLVNQWAEEQYKLANTWLNMVVDGTLHIKRMERGHTFVVIKKKEKAV